MRQALRLASRRTDASKHMARIPISNTVRIRTMVVASIAVGVCLWLAPPSNVQLGVVPAVCVAVVLLTSWSLAERLAGVASGMLTAALATVCLLVLMQAGPSGTLWSPVILVPVLVARFTSGHRMALWSSFGVATMFCLGPVSYTHLTLPTICSV